MSDTPQTQVEESPVLEGSSPELSNDEMRRKAIDTAFDYRGDVTIETREGQQYEGYLFNRFADADPPYAKMMLSAGGEIEITYADVARLTFSGKDTAAGKTWENWVKRYIEKKMAGEAANIESETL